MSLLSHASEYLTKLRAPDSSRSRSRALQVRCATLQKELDKEKQSLNRLEDAAEEARRWSPSRSLNLSHYFFSPCRLSGTEKDARRAAIAALR